MPPFVTINNVYFDNILTFDARIFLLTIKIILPAVCFSFVCFFYFLLLLFLYWIALNWHIIILADESIKFVKITTEKNSKNIYIRSLGSFVLVQKSEIQKNWKWLQEMERPKNNTKISPDSYGANANTFCGINMILCNIQISDIYCF